MNRAALATLLIAATLAGCCRMTEAPRGPDGAATNKPSPVIEAIAAAWPPVRAVLCTSLPTVDPPLWAVALRGLLCTESAPAAPTPAPTPIDS